MQIDTLYVTDLDGTLLGPDSLISPRSAELISRLVEEGAHITVATARTPATVETLLEGTYTRLPVIVLTGAAMWDRERRRYLYPHFIDNDLAEAVLDEFRRANVAPFVYTLRDDGVLHVYHNGEMNDVSREFMNERLGLPLKKFHLDLPEMDTARFIPSTVLYFAMGKADKVYPLADAIRQRVDCSVYSYLDIFHPDVAIIEVFAAQVSKANAVKKLARREGLKRIVVFGDSSNDIPMMDIATVAVAPENAILDAKRAAHVIIPGNDHDSVAEFILHDYYSTDVDD